jgi:hypothetical protein
MLQGMQTHTQFILITHNRKAMEIAGSRPIENGPNLPAETPR